MANKSGGRTYAVNLDMVRKTRAKEEIDIDPKTLETWGIKFYQMGGCIFFSRSEVESFIRTNGIVIFNNPDRRKLETEIARLETRLTELRKRRDSMSEQE